MPIPVIVALIFEIIAIVGTALTVDELLSTMEELFEDYKKFSGGVERAEQEIKRLMERIEKEIAQGIDKKEELIFLEAETKLDPQNPNTREAKGAGAGAPIINKAIQQNIPFRRVISRVCDQADRLPIPSLRKKKGATVKDLPTSKAKALAELLRMGVEELADVNLQDLIVVRLRQLATSLIFEYIDKLLDWKSPMKAEVSFGPDPRYEDHPVKGSTQLKRSGSGINPFYPGPFHRRSSITADLIITEYRAERCDKHNIFALIEIKFAGDRIDEDQFIKYRRMLMAAAKAKSAKFPIRHKGNDVSSGGRLSLFRYPLDKAAEHGQGDPAQDKADKTQKPNKPGKGSKKAKP